MSPLFPCAGCGIQIERTVRLYREQRGRVLCSSCKDRLERADAAEADPAAAREPRTPGDPGPSTT